MLVSGEDETGNVDAGSRASSEVALQVREVRAKELAELLCETLNETLIRWIVDLNFGTNVVAPKVRRDFRVEEGSKLTMNDVSILISQVGYRPTKEWIETTYKVELEEPEEAAAPVEEMPPEEEAPPEESTPTADETASDDQEIDALLTDLESAASSGGEEESSGDDTELDDLLSELTSGDEEKKSK